MHIMCIYIYSYINTYVYIQRGERQCHELLGFTPTAKPHRTATHSDADDECEHRDGRVLPISGTGVSQSSLSTPLRSGATNMHAVGSVGVPHSPTRAASSVIQAMLENSAPLGSSPAKRRLGDRKARAAMLGF